MSNIIELNSIATETLIETIGIDSIKCLYVDYSTTGYEQGRWSGNNQVFYPDDTAKDVVPW